MERMDICSTVLTSQLIKQLNKYFIAQYSDDLGREIIIFGQFMEVQRFDYAIVGGGTYGLCAAYFLAKSQAKVAIFEQFTIGHDLGSSHGPTRIIREAYKNENMARLAKHSRQSWREMQTSLNSKLIFDNDFLYMTDQPQVFDSFRETAEKFPSTQRAVKYEELCMKYPPFLKAKLPVDIQGIMDGNAGIIAADDFLIRLTEYLQGLSNVVIFENTEVKQVRDNKKHAKIILESQQIIANKVIITAGHWLNTLIPEMQNLVTPVKQYYYQIEVKQRLQYQVGRFPSFQLNLQQDEFYLLPERKNYGVKFGIQFHKQPQIPISLPNIKKKLLDAAMNFLGENFNKILSFEECLYTSTQTGQFIIDWMDPENQTILVCSCCSGHGFKFSPYLGKVCADLCVDDRSDEIFQGMRHTFQLPYHRGINLQ